MALIIKANGDTEETVPAKGKSFDLKEMQAVVGGYIEYVYLASGDVMVANEEGLLENLPVNQEASAIAPAGWIVGDVLICTKKEAGF